MPFSIVANNKFETLGINVESKKIVLGKVIKTKVDNVLNYN